MASRKRLSSKGNRQVLENSPKPPGHTGGAFENSIYFKYLRAHLVGADGLHRRNAQAGPAGVAFASEARHTRPMQALNDPRVEAAVAEYFRTVSTRNKNAWIKLFDKSAVLHEPVGATPAEGREGLEQVWQVFTGPFAKLTFDINEVFYSGSGAAARWSAQASSSDGRDCDFHGITVFEVDDEGRIQTVMSYWDPAAVLIELAGGDGIDDLLH